MHSIKWLFCWLSFVATLLGFTIAYFDGIRNDYIALNLRIVNDTDKNILPTVFNLYFSQLNAWEDLTEQFAELWKTDVDSIRNQVQYYLEQSKYNIENSDDDLLQGKQSVDSHQAVFSLLNTLDLLIAANYHHKYFTSCHKRPHRKHLSDTSSINTQSAPIDKVPNYIHRLLNPSYGSKLPLFLHAESPPIIIYNSLGVSTGGTTAMKILHDTLKKMGYNTLLCNDGNRFSDSCRRPSDSSLIVTGEWCHEVLQEYTDAEPPSDLNVNVNTITNCDSTNTTGGEGSERDSKLFTFLGRGVQYYLGSHHNDDSCKGRVAIGDSHFLNQQLGRRLLGAYYLGCPMTPVVLHAYSEIVNTIRYNEVNEGEDEGDEGVVHVTKENLLIVDPDFDRDYPPEQPMVFHAPVGWKVLYAQDIPAAQMPLLLQRAKIVLDLGMPGPERISGEALLFGCIPVVSERWNGASRVDFPGIHRVDPTDGPQITATLEHIALNYEEELNSTSNAQFLRYILSLDSMLIETADVVFGSSYIHFILTADSLQQEYTLTFQMLALIYLYPLCSIDLYVHDVVWFVRHHYAFHDILKSAGYIREDPLNPTEFSRWRRSSGGQAYVNIKSVVLLRQGLSEMLVSTQNDDEDTHTAAITVSTSDAHLSLVPSWRPLLVVLRQGVVLRDPETLFEWVSDIREDSARGVFIGSEGSAGGVSLCDHSAGVVCAPNDASQLALIVSPHAILTSDLIDTLFDSVARVEHSVGDIGKRLNGDGDVTTVYDLLAASQNNVERSGSGSSDDDHHVVDNIIHSIPWITMKSYASQLDFEC